MKVDNNAAQIMGGVFIIIGILGCIIIGASFDYATYSEIKGMSYTYSDEIAYMKEELLTTWIYAIAALVGNVAIGIVLITLGRILGVLEIIATGKKTEAKPDGAIEKLGNKASEYIK